MVYILIITYNSSKTIKDCLISLNNQTYKNFNVLLVDNNSEDATVDVIESVRGSLDFPFKTIFLEKNLGFSGGNNVAYEQISQNCEYISLLNPDASAHHSWLKELVDAMESHPDVGICASKILVDGKSIIDSAGDGYATSLKGFKRGEGMKSDPFNNMHYVFGACAGAALYRKKMIEDIGFLDGDFFLIHEDTDLNLRAQLSGWKVFYVSSAIAYHKVRSSIGHMSDIAIYYTLRNSEFVRIKNIPFTLFLRCLPEFLIGSIFEFYYFALKNKKLKVYFSAKKDAIKLIPKMLEKRRVIMNNKKVDNRCLYNLMTPFWHKEFFYSKAKKFLNG